MSRTIKSRRTKMARHEVPNAVPTSTRPAVERLLTEAEVAQWLCISPLTLRKWRCQRTQPLPFLKIAKVIRYKESDLLPFVESHMVVPRSL
jgi:hypothetical protein